MLNTGRAMKLGLRNTELLLPHQGLLRLEQARGLQIQCMAGRVWVTMAGRSDDIFLDAGETLTVSHPGVTLVEGMMPSRVALCYTKAVPFELQALQAACAG